MVITIIVLLILAGISINMIAGNNSILQKATYTKKYNDQKKAQELIQIEILGALDVDGTVNKDRLKSGLEKIGAVIAKEDFPETIMLNGFTFIVNSDGKVRQLPEATGISALNSTKTIINIGETAQLTPTFEPDNSTGTVVYSSSDDTVASVSSEGIVTGLKKGTATIRATVKGISKIVNITVQKVEMAVDKLIVNTSATNDAEKSPYVKYTYSGENTILCRVLYDKNDPYGLQIIAVSPVRSVNLGLNDNSGKISGNDDFEKAMNSYNRVIETLNEYAETYMDTTDGSGIVSDARCVGSDPSGKNIESTTISIENNNYGTVNLKNKDTHYTTDETRLRAIGAVGFVYNSMYTNGYWLASREVSNNSFHIRNMYSSGVLTSTNLCSVSSNTQHGYGAGGCGLRPVFTLNPGVRITEGSGTSEDPYEIGM